MAPGSRDELVGALAAAVGAIARSHPTRVAVDGSPGAGKTTLADELAGVLRASGREVVRATIDDFLVPRDRRYRRGEFSGVGCYLDAHDRDALRRLLLSPLGPAGDRRVRTAVHDAVLTPVSENAVLLFDGVFLLRPELAGHWDYRVFVSTAFETALHRALVREQTPPAVTERRWRERYEPAQQLYRTEARPAERADVVVHNDDPQRPRWSYPKP